MSKMDDIQYRAAMRESAYREREKERSIGRWGWVVLAVIAAYIVWQVAIR